jgi:hypothetical protein
VVNGGVPNGNALFVPLQPGADDLAFTLPFVQFFIDVLYVVPGSAADVHPAVDHPQSLGVPGAVCESINCEPLPGHVRMLAVPRYCVEAAGSAQHGIDVGRADVLVFAAHAESYRRPFMGKACLIEDGNGAKSCCNRRTVVSSGCSGCPGTSPSTTAPRSGTWSQSRSRATTGHPADRSSRPVEHAVRQFL